MKSILIDNCHKSTLISLTLAAIVSVGLLPTSPVVCLPLDSSTSSTSTTTAAPSVSNHVDAYDQSNLYLKYQQLGLRNMILPGLFMIPPMINSGFPVANQPQPMKSEQIFKPRFDSSSSTNPSVRTVLEPTTTTESPITTTTISIDSRPKTGTLTNSPNLLFKRFWQRQMALEKSIPVTDVLFAEAIPVPRERLGKRIIFTAPTLSDTIDDLQLE